MLHEYEDGGNLVGEHVGVGCGGEPLTCNNTSTITLLCTTTAHLTLNLLIAYPMVNYIFKEGTKYIFVPGFIFFTSKVFSAEYQRK
jgi:hypothetical protein